MDTVDRTTRTRFSVLFVALAFALLVSLGVGYAIPFTRIAAGYAAKVACTAHFVDGRPLERIQSDELGFLRGLHLEVDSSARTMRAWILPGQVRVAKFEPAIGAILLTDRNSMPVEKPTLPDPMPSADEANEQDSWPDGNAAPRLQNGTFSSALELAFDGEVAERTLRTRAVVIVHHDRIVAERYAPDITPDSVLPGWSMSKSVTSSLVGILLGEGRLDLRGTTGFPEWQDDERRSITLLDLLRMESGLDLTEDYGNPRSDVLRMLFRAKDMAAYAASRPLSHPPGTHWSYASGSTLLVQRMIREAIGDDAAYHSLPQAALFGPIGISSALFERDAAGTFVGSSYVHMTARDWARFGLLFLHDGVWRNRRVLPAGFVDYVTTPAPHAPKGNYGAHWWLNRGTAGAERPFPSLPEDMFFANGHEGQFVIVIPSSDAVIVRLGLTQNGASFPLEAFVGAVLRAM